MHLPLRADSPGEQPEMTAVRLVVVTLRAVEHEADQRTPGASLRRASARALPHQLCGEHALRTPCVS